MKLIITVAIMALGLTLSPSSGKHCGASGHHGGNGPGRIVRIQGKVLFESLPGGGKVPTTSYNVPATSETVIFQKDGCDTCYVATRPASDGSYEILVGDGVYRVYVRPPSDPEIDFLSSKQPRTVDTSIAVNQSIEFNISLTSPNR